MATISNTPRPGYVWDSTDNVWYPIGVGNHNHSEIAKTIVDAKGDLIVGTANDTVARQAVGTDGQALLADSTQTNGIKWGSALPDQTSQSGNYLTTNGTTASWAAVPTGSMTLISTTTINNNATIALTSIPQTYNSLRVVIRNLKVANDGENLWIRFNNDSGANRYRYLGYNVAGTANTFNSTYMSVMFNIDNTVANGLMTMDIPDYTNTATWKMMDSKGFGNDNTTSTSITPNPVFGYYNQTSAISEIDIFASLGNLTSGTILLYGVK